MTWECNRAELKGNCFGWFAFCRLPRFLSSRTIVSISLQWCEVCIITGPLHFRCDSSCPSLFSIKNIILLCWHFPGSSPKPLLGGQQERDIPRSILSVRCLPFSWILWPDLGSWYLKSPVSCNSNGPQPKDHFKCFLEFCNLFYPFWKSNLKI